MTEKLQVHALFLGVVHTVNCEAPMQKLGPRAFWAPITLQCNPLDPNVENQILNKIDIF